MRIYTGTGTHFNTVRITYCSRLSLTQITLDCDFADFYAFGKTNNEFLWEHACSRPKRLRTSVERTGQNPHLQLSTYNHLERNLSQKKKKGAAKPFLFRVF